MLTENEIKNQIELARSYRDSNSMDFDEFTYIEGYMSALKAVLQLKEAEYSKEDI